MTYQQIPKRTQENIQIPQTTSQLASRPFTPIAKQTTSTPTHHQQLGQTEALLPTNTNLLAIPGLTATPQTKVSQEIQGEPTIGQPGDSAVQATSNVEQETLSPVIQSPKILGKKKITGSRKFPYFKIKSSNQSSQISQPEATPLADDEFFLSQNVDHLDIYRRVIREYITYDNRNKINFDPSSVQYKPYLFGTEKREGNILKWDSSWGLKPTPTSKYIEKILQAKGVVLWAHQLAGWTKLDSSEQTILESLLSGETNNLSHTVRENINTNIKKSNLDIDDLDPTQQADLLRSYITDKNLKPDMVTEPVTSGKVGYSFLTPEPITEPEFKFKDVTAEAEMYVLQFDDSTDDSSTYSLDITSFGDRVPDIENIQDYRESLSQRITIVAASQPKTTEYTNLTGQFEFFIPDTTGPILNSLNYRVQQIADSLRNLPKETRLIIHAIILEPVEASVNSYYATKFSNPDFRAGMTATESGNIRVYPPQVAKNENDLSLALLHESGHIWSRQSWGKDPSKGKWLEWKKMMDADKVSVSSYAMESIQEDFSETLAIYLGTKNSLAFEEYRQIVPKRFAMLDKEYKSLPSTFKKDVNGLFINQTVGDGNCFFHAVFEAMYNIRSTQADQTTIRQTVADELQNNPRVRGHLFGGENPDLASIRQVVTGLGEGEWTQDYTAGYVAEALNLTIHIYNEDGSDRYTANPTAASASHQTIHITYTGNHFNSHTQNPL